MTVSPALRALPDFECQPDRYKPMFSLEVIKGSAPRDLPFKVALNGQGFEATSELSLDDIENIRDWCQQVLAAAGALQVA